MHFEADIIALDGDPLADPAALGRAVFVMRGGTSTGTTVHGLPVGEEFPTARRRSSPRPGKIGHETWKNDA